MLPQLLFDQLVLSALVGLFILLHLAERNRAASSPQRPVEPEPLKSKRHRSAEPTPVPGLTPKPPCPRGTAESAVVVAPTPVRPEPLAPTNRRPRRVDPSRHVCPHDGCAYRGGLGLGNLRANGRPSDGPWRQFQCLGCQGYFWETPGTMVHGKRTAGERIVHVLACLAEGLGSRATARVFAVDPHTVLQWWGEAAAQLRAFSASFLCAVHVKPVQLDELYAGLREVKAGDLSAAEAIKPLERSPSWVGTAMDPENKLLLVIAGGTRSLEMAQRVVHQVAAVFASGCVPLFLTDGLKDYGTAMLAHFGSWLQPERGRDQGPRPKPRGLPRPELLYAQVVKAYRRRRLVGVTHRVVFGTWQRGEQRLSADGWKINPAFVERLNLAMRQRVAAVGRRVNPRCQGEASLQHQLVLFQSYHNFVLPHAGLRQPLLVPEPAKGRGSTQVWRPRTPARAAGLTAHVWTLREVRLSRVPPWPHSC
jgi:hypothetical protein